MVFLFFGQPFGISPDWLKNHALEISSRGHIGAYALLLITLGGNRKFSLVKAILITTLISVLLEAGQIMLPSRQAGMTDIYYNLVGITIGALLLLAFRRISEAREFRRIKRVP
jgi:VanZ family protein